MTAFSKSLDVWLADGSMGRLAWSNMKELRPEDVVPPLCVAPHVKVGEHTHHREGGGLWMTAFSTRLQVQLACILLKANPKTASFSVTVPLPAAAACSRRLLPAPSGCCPLPAAAASAVQAA